MYFKGSNRIRHILGLPPRDYIEKRKRLALRYLPKNPVIIDAGAHDGNDSMLMARIWPQGTIHAFEPVPATFAKLYRATQHYTNIRTYHLALGNLTGKATMHVSSGNDADSSSLFSPTGSLASHPVLRFESSVEVDVMTLDDWSEKFNVRHVDFLWLDMQGGELSAMQSGRKLLTCVRAVICEVAYIREYDGAPLHNEIKSWMNQAGFYVKREWKNGPESGDVFFVRRI
ncbi:MAG: FkbM family methyltransferase [Planctomycetota bacterium]|nr:FkbM family methyltransferase [Planctomycetota bacterium]